MSEIDFSTHAPAGRTCVACGQVVKDEYWEANGQVACTPCKSRIAAAPLQGTGASRFLMASALGTGAAALGAVVWWAVAEFANIEAAIIAIGIGWLVGNAVRFGAQARGGWLYQVMAVSLTYLSIVMAYVVLMVRTMEEAQKAELGVMLLPAVVFFSFVAPFMGGGVGSILSVIIIGIGLWTAWGKNRKLVIEWTGPHAIAPMFGAPPPVPSGSAGGADPQGPPPLPPSQGG